MKAASASVEGLEKEYQHYRLHLLLAVNLGIGEQHGVREQEIGVTYQH